SVVGPDVLEDRRVTRLFGMMVDVQVDTGKQAAEVVRLDVDRRDAAEGSEVFRGVRLDLDVEQIDHADVFRTRHAAHGPDDGGRLGAAQDVAQGQAGRHRVRVRLVVQEDQNLVGVGEIPLVLLDAGAGQRTAELGRQ